MELTSLAAHLSAVILVASQCTVALAVYCLCAMRKIHIVVIPLAFALAMTAIPVLFCYPCLGLPDHGTVAKQVSYFVLELFEEQTDITYTHTVT